jgi:uncharacterized glyoxalase superfamily protein PhnB
MAKIRGNSMRVEPYLMFGGGCAEAMAFCQRAIDAQLKVLLRFK